MAVQEGGTLAGLPVWGEGIHTAKSHRQVAAGLAGILPSADAILIMERLNPKKLHVTYLTGTNPEELILPRRYTLTHSDITGNLFLSIGNQYNTKQISKLYTKLMRDEVLAELSDDGDNLLFRIYCHVSGGFVLGTAKWRYNIFQSELPLVLEAIRYGDRTIFEQNPKLDNAPILIHFQSTNSRFNKVEDWGTMVKYR